MEIFGPIENSQEWTILLVDDDEDDYLLAKDMLTKSEARPIHLVWAPSYEAGTEALRSEHYDAVLVDYDLGLTNGIELIRQQIESGYAEPLILLTGRGSYAVDLEAQQAGAISYLAKSEATPLLLERTIRYAIERNKVEKALQKNEAHLAEAQKVAKMGSWELNLPELTGTWSDQMYVLLGLEPADPAPPFDEFFKTVHPDDREVFLQKHAEATEQGRQVSFEYRGITASGEIQYFEANAEGILDGEGRVTKAVGTLQNITERKHMQRAKEKIHIQAELIDNVSDAVLSVNNEFSIKSWNKGAETLYGWTADEVIGKPFIDIVPTEYPEEPREAFLEALYETGRWTGVVRQKRKDGSPVYIQTAVSRLFDMNGTAIGAAAINRDITDWKHAEEERLMLLRESQHRLEVVESLHSVDVAINATIDLGTILNIVLSHIISRLNADAVDILLYSQESRSFEFAAGRGFQTNIPQHVRFDLLNSYAGQIVLERRMIQVTRLENPSPDRDFSELWTAEVIKSYIGVPLISKGQVKGVLEVYHRRAFSPEPEWLSFLEMLAGQAAISIDNARLYESAQRANHDLSLAVDSTIEGWSRTMERRAAAEQGHSQRLASLAVDIAVRIGVSAYELPHIRHGALLHDIGNIIIPDSILFKAAELTGEERVIVQVHPQAAYDMLAPIRYLLRALDIPFCHHENWDGTGYPRGISREEIPLAARIFAVADVWLALTSDRPHRTAWTAEQAFDYIRSQSGKQFDPKVVDVFMEIMESR